MSITAQLICLAIGGLLGGLFMLAVIKGRKDG